MSQNRPEHKPLVNHAQDGQDVEVDETVPTEAQKTEWRVAANKPRYLSIPALGIANSRVREIGVVKDGRIGVPVNIFDVAWFNQSALPGAPGAMLIDGHNGGPTLDGVFKRLGTLAVGATLTIERGDGEIFNYKVVEKRTLTVEEADSYMGEMLQPVTAGKEGLNLITCTGTWNNKELTYDKRVIIRAERV